MSYNGWCNWETWNVALWCDKEEAVYRDRMRSKPRAAEDCEAFVREYFPKGTPDMIGEWADDAYNHAAVAVDWEEIASHWSADYEDEDELKRRMQHD